MGSATWIVSVQLRYFESYLNLHPTHCSDKPDSSSECNDKTNSPPLPLENKAHLSVPEISDKGDISCLNEVIEIVGFP